MGLDLQAYLDLRKEQERQRYKFIAETIKKGMAPFEPGSIRIMVENTIPGYKVTVEVSNAPLAVASYVIDPASLDKTDAEDMLKFLGHRFFAFFRMHRPIEPEDNIQLGEG